jgi:hypothetical protein
VEADAWEEGKEGGREGGAQGGRKRGVEGKDGSCTDKKCGLSRRKWREEGKEEGREGGREGGRERCLTRLNSACSPSTLTHGVLGAPAFDQTSLERGGGGEGGREGGREGWMNGWMEKGRAGDA